MKKVMSIIALALALTMMMSVAAFAADGFVVDTTVSNVTATAAGDDITVTIADAVDGAYYGVLLTGEVAEGSYPTDETPIYYINQETAPAGFAVKPIVPEETTPMTLFVSTNAAGVDLVRIPVSYVIEPEVTGPAVTFMNGTETVATLTAAEGAVVAPAGSANVPTPGEGALISRYEFVGWTDADGTVTYAAGDSIPATAEMTLYAKYQMYDKEKNCVMVWGDYTGDGKVLMPDMTQIINFFKNKSACTRRDLVGKKLDADHMTTVFGDVVVTGTVIMPDMTQMINFFKNKSICTVKDALGTPIYFVNK